VLLVLRLVEDAYRCGHGFEKARLVQDWRLGVLSGRSSLRRKFAVRVLGRHLACLDHVLQFFVRQVLRVDYRLGPQWWEFFVMAGVGCLLLGDSTVCDHCVRVRDWKPGWFAVIPWWWPIM